MDFVEDLAEGIENGANTNKTNEKRIIKRSPHIKVTIMGSETLALLDTGSEATAV